MISQVTKHAEISQTQYFDHAAAVPVVTQRQVPRLQTFSKTAKVPPAQFIGRAVDVPVVRQRQGPQFQAVPKSGRKPRRRSSSANPWTCRRSTRATKHAWIPQNMYVDTVVNTPVAMHQHFPQVQTVPVTVDVPLVQSADSAHRQGRRRAGGDVTTFSSAADCAQDGG